MQYKNMSARVHAAAWDMPPVYKLSPNLALETDSDSHHVEISIMLGINLTWSNTGLT